MDDFTALTGPDHWLGWLGDDPAQALRGEVEGILREQVPSARLAWIRLLGEPCFLTSGRKIPEDPTSLIVTRAGLAVAFQLEVASDDGAEQLRGVFSWVASRLDGDRRDRVFLDLDADMESAADSLKQRLYEIDLEPEPVEEPVTRRPWWAFWRN